MHGSFASFGKVSSFGIFINVKSKYHQMPVIDPFQDKVKSINYNPPSSVKEKERLND